MTRIWLILSLVTWAGIPRANAAPKPPPSQNKTSLQVVHLSAPGGATFAALLDAEVTRAHAAHLHPYLQFSAEWCPPCKAFKHYLDDPMMRDALDGVYLIVADYDQWESVATKLGVVGIPTWIELDAAGQPTPRHIVSDVWKEDIPANMAPPLKAFFHPRQTP